MINVDTTSWVLEDGEYKLCVPNFSNRYGTNIIIDFAYSEHRSVAMYVCYYNNEVGELNVTSIEDAKTKLYNKVYEYTKSQANYYQSILSSMCL
jgi:hypothetical protein